MDPLQGARSGDLHVVTEKCKLETSKSSVEFILPTRRKKRCYQRSGSDTDLTSETDATFSASSVVSVETKASVNQEEICRVFEDKSKVLKPENDHRQYEAIRLSNDIKVLVISDPVTSKCAAALAVQVGSMNDPKELPGLAHFCEHLIFASGKKSDDEFERLVGYNGGDINSFTRRDLTVFGFDILPESFLPALQQFANFFTDMEFTEDDMEQSISAINSEFDRAVGIDVERRDRVDAALTSPEHPYHQFDIGNTLSLWTRPKSKCINLREEALKFIRQSYSSNLMTLAILGTQSTEQLAALAEEYFSPIPNYHLDLKTWPTSPYAAEHFKTRIDIVPIRDISKLLLIFPVPDFSSNYESGIIQYVTFIVGRDGPGSLIWLLRERSWATRLEPVYKRPGKGFAFFNLHIDLTHSGLKNVNNVVHNTFQYFKMLKVEGPQRWMWEEIRTMQHASFRFTTPESPLNRVENLATHMTDYPAHHYLAGKHIVRSYLPTKIREFLDCLSPTNFRMILSDKSNLTIADEMEEWCGVRYRYSEIDEGHITKWEECILHDELHLPSKNRFIPESFQLKPQERKSGRAKPRIIFDGSVSSVWFVQDTELKVPCATITLAMLSPLQRVSADNFNFLRLIEKALNEALLEVASDARHAGLSHKIDATMQGLTISVHGFDNKVGSYFEFVLSTLFQFCGTGKVGHRFQDIKDEYADHLAKWKDQEPYAYGVEFIRCMLNLGTWHPEQLLEAYRGEDVTSTNLMSFGQRFLRKLKLVWFFYGNLTEQEAFSIYQQNVMYFEQIGTVPYDPREAEDTSGLPKLNSTSTEFSILHPNHMESCCVLLLQIGKESTVRETILTETMNAIIKRPAAGALRTEEQFVWTDVRKSKTFLGLQIILQDEKDPIILERKIENFLGKLELVLAKYTEKDITRFRAEVANRKIERWKLPKARAQILFEEILKETYNFQRHQQEMNQLQRIRQKDVLDFYAENISPASSVRRKLCVLVASSLSRRDVVQLQNHSTEALPLQSEDGLKPESEASAEAEPKDTDGEPKVLKGEEKKQKEMRTVQSGSNASIADSLEKRSSELLKAEKPKPERRSLYAPGRWTRGRPNGPTRPPKINTARPKPAQSSGRLNQTKNETSDSVDPNGKKQNPAKPVAVTKPATSALVNRKPSRIRPKPNPQPARQAVSKVDTRLDDKLLAKIADASNSSGKPPKDVMQNWVTQIRKNQIVRENSMMVRTITSKVLHKKAPPLPVLQYLQKAEDLDQKLLERIYRLHQSGPAASRHEIKSAKPSRTVVTTKIIDMKKQQQPKKQESKPAIAAAKKTTEKFEGKTDSVDFRDYEFDFEAEIRRLRTLKKYLQYENAVRRSEKQKKAESSNAGTTGNQTLPSFFADAEGEDQTAPALPPKPPVRSDYNAAYEIQRLKALKQLLDTEAAKYSRSSTNNNAQTQPAQPTRKVTRKGQGVSVHEVEREIQRLKNIKRYFDGETKDLNLHNVEYTIFVLYDIKISNPAPRIKNILSSVQRGRHFRSHHSSAPLTSSTSIKDYEARKSTSKSTERKPNLNAGPKVPSHIVPPYIRRTSRVKSQNNSISSGSHNSSSGLWTHSQQKHLTMSKSVPRRQVVIAPSHYILKKRSSSSQNRRQPQTISQIMNHHLVVPASLDPSSSSHLRRKNDPKINPYLDPLQIMEKAVQNAMALNNTYVSNLFGFTSTDRFKPQPSSRSRLLSSLDLGVRIPRAGSVASATFPYQQQRPTLRSRSMDRTGSLTLNQSQRSSSLASPISPNWKGVSDLAEERISRILNRAVEESKRSYSGQRLFPKNVLQTTRSWNGKFAAPLPAGPFLRTSSNVLKHTPGSYSSVYPASGMSSQSYGTPNLNNNIRKEASYHGGLPMATFESASSLIGIGRSEKNLQRPFAPLPVIPRSLRGNEGAENEQETLRFAPSETQTEDGYDYGTDSVFLEAFSKEAETVLMNFFSAQSADPLISESYLHDRLLEELGFKNGGAGNVEGKDEVARAVASVETSSNVESSDPGAVTEAESNSLVSPGNESESSDAQPVGGDSKLHGDTVDSLSHSSIIEKDNAESTLNATQISEAVEPLNATAPPLLVKSSKETHGEADVSLAKDPTPATSDHLRATPPESIESKFNEQASTASAAQSITNDDNVNKEALPDNKYQNAVVEVEPTELLTGSFVNEPSPKSLSQVATSVNQNPLIFAATKKIQHIANPTSSAESTSNNVAHGPAEQQQSPLKVTTASNTGTLFSTIAKALFQIEQHDLAEAQAQSSSSESTAKDEKRSSSKTPSGSGTPELRKWMKSVVSTELQTYMRELARKAMNAQQASASNGLSTQFTLQPVLYNPPSRVLRAVKKFPRVVTEPTPPKPPAEEKPPESPRSIIDTPDLSAVGTPTATPSQEPSKLPSAYVSASVSRALSSEKIASPQSPEPTDT